MKNKHIKQHDYNEHDGIIDYERSGLYVGIGHITLYVQGYQAVRRFRSYLDKLNDDEIDVWDHFVTLYRREG